MRGIDPVFGTVTPIRYRGVEGGGTGFFLNHNGQTFIITNRHVVYPDSGDENPTEAYVWFRDATNPGQAHRSTIRLMKDGKPKWYEYPEIPTEIDLAAIPLHPQLSSLDALEDEDQSPNSGSLAYTFDHFIHENVQPDQRVSVIGYPADFVDRSTWFPVRRNALISSPYGHPFEDRPFFVTDARMHPGTSGSPVVMESKNMMSLRGEVPDNRSKSIFLLGVHSATFYATPFEEDEGVEEDESEKGKEDIKLGVTDPTLLASFGRSLRVGLAWRT
ncbi:S1 family peptidase, partial [Saliphagus infecundisoli]